jgi:RNA recognition motif-containing protein
MSKTLFVGNLPVHMAENDLRSLFAQAGEVESVSIITDRETGRSRGFGFVAMSDDGAEKAIAQFNGTQLDGRALTVSEAHPLIGRDFVNRRSGSRGRGGSGRH